jgi:hypothetical protein
VQHGAQVVEMHRDAEPIIQLAAQRNALLKHSLRFSIVPSMTGHVTQGIESGHYESLIAAFAGCCQALIEQNLSSFHIPGSIPDHT